MTSRTVVASSQRLDLRGFELADLEAFAAIVGDPKVMSFVGDNKPLSLERAERWLHLARERQAAGEPTTYAVFLKEDDVFAGYAGFTRHNVTDLEIIYGVAKSYWHQGYGTELARTLLNLGFHQFGHARLWATVDPENRASIRIVENLGMRPLETRLDENGLPERLYLLERENWR